MFYLYLFKKYKSPCFLRETVGDFWEILGITLNIREFYSVEESGKINRYLNRFAWRLAECIKKDVNIIIIPLGLTLCYPDGTTDGHANVLIYRKKFNHIEHFEPHGQSGSFNDEKLNSSLDLFLKLFVEYVNIELQIKDLKPIELIESNKVCPYIRGLQSYEDSSEIFKNKEVESGGYCSAWSMFFTELCLKNPEMTSSQIIEKVFSAALDKSLFFTTEDYFRHIIRGYATFINEKISTYFKFLLDDNKIDIAKIKKMSLENRAILKDKVKIIINIESELTFNPSALDTKIHYFKHKLQNTEVLYTVDYFKTKMTLSVLEKYKNHISDFNSLIDTPPTPPPLSLLKTQKTPINCPPGKVLNPKTGRCINVKPEKTVRQILRENKEALEQELRNITKECPPGKVLNPDTGRCVKVKPVKRVIKKEQKELNEPANKLKECPPGKVLNPKTGRCNKIKNKTRKIKEIKRKEDKICPPGKMLNPKTNRCNKIKNKTVKVKKEIKLK